MVESEDVNPWQQELENLKHLDQGSVDFELEDDDGSNFNVQQ